MGRLAGVLVACSLVGSLATCGSDRPADPGFARSESSSPFLVEVVPDDFVGALAGEGTSGPTWGADEEATDEPFTVLSEDGRPDGDDLTIVSFTGYEGRQGGLAQASRGRNDRATRVEIDGHDAFFTPAFDDEGIARWSDLVVDQGSDLAVRITSPEATLDQLEAVLPSVVTPTAHDRAPEIVNPPYGLQVVGSVDTVAVAATGAFVEPDRRLVPGPPGSHSASWERKNRTRDQIVAMTIPGTSVDLEVISFATYAERFLRTQRVIEVGDRPAVLLETSSLQGDGKILSRSIWQRTEWGDVLVVHSRGDDGPVDTEALVSMAASVHLADPDEWATFRDDLDGGAGFRADNSREEVTRGEVDGTQWLLQTSAPDGGDDPASPVDGCLKLSTGERRCAGGGTLAGLDTILFSNDDAGPPFLIFTTDKPVASLRAVTAEDEEVVTLVPIPGSDAVAGVLFLPDHASVTCAADVAPGQITVRAIDAEGADLGCADFGPEGVFGGI